MDNKENCFYIRQITICKNSEFFKYNITYPVLKLCDKYIYDKNIIDNINNKIYQNVITFKNNIKKEAIEYKKLYYDYLSNNNVKYKYEVYINNEVTYYKNNIISIVITEYEFNGEDYGMTYLKNYNYNLLNGDILTLKDMFKSNTYYEKIVNNFILQEINKNPEFYFKGDDSFKEIVKNQTFYIDNDGIVIYFEVYDIAPYYLGMPKFKLKFNEFGKYLNYN